MSNIIKERNHLAELHKESRYYKNVDNEDGLRCFWHEESPFYKMFTWLDLTNVVELACGHGRHVAQYMDTAGSICLVDILDENINIVKERFKNNEKITYYKNDGFSLSEIQSNSATALFTYDAMVHFNFFDVLEYIKETYRILKPGGMALFHHSNYTGSPGNSFHNNPSWRNFMSANIFYHAASGVGFTVLKQHLINWGGIGNLDALSLVIKPEIEAS